VEAVKFCGSGSTLKKEAGSRGKLGSIFYKTWGRDMEAVKFLWKQ